MITKNFNIYVDFNNKVIYAPTRFTAGDSGSCTMTFKTVQDITGLRVFVNFLMSDATTYILEATVSDANTATLTLPSGVLSVVGEVTCQVALYGTTERLTQPLSFGYTVVTDLADSAIAASDQYPIITQLILDCEAIKDAEALRKEDELTRIENEGSRKEAEGLRKQAETARENAEDLRDTAEGQRELAEGARQDAYVLAEGDRNTAYGVAEGVRDGLYTTAEGSRNTAYGEAEVARDGLYTTAEGVRDVNAANREAARDGLYEAAEAARDTIVGGLDARVKVTELQGANQQLELNDIERTIALMNPTQSTRVDITSAAQTVPLPKTAGIGPVRPTIKGLTATNMVNGSNIAVGNTVTFASVLNSKYYDSLHGTVLTGDGNNMTVTNDTAATANIMVINLTATFPSAEPNAATCALLFPTYFDGTQSVIAPRLRSVGKNLFDNLGMSWSLGVLDANGAFVSHPQTILTRNGTYLTMTTAATFRGIVSDFVKVAPSTAYRIAVTKTAGADSNNPYISGGGRCYDANKNYLGALTSIDNITTGRSGGTFTTLAGTAFVRFYFANATVTTSTWGDIQLEAGTDATTYEPYTDLSALYTEPLTLRSNATDQDTITPTDGKMIYQQRIDPSTYATLSPLPAPIEVATSGILQSYPSGTIYAEHALADAGLYTTSIGVLNTDFPIESLESLYKVDAVTGVKTALAHGTATIAGDGLSFTHAGLTSGDIVFFTYHYAFTGVWGANVYSHFDGSMVVADTANSKFYSWKISSTNGVASIVLTEVT